MNKEIKANENKKYRLDIIFIAAILTVSLIAVGIMLLTREEGAEVVVYVDGKEVGRYSLSEDGEYSVNGGTNVFVIENGEVYMKTSTCHGYQDCVEKGRIKYKNETIVCLPNHVELRIEGDADDSGVEIVS